MANSCEFTGCCGATIIYNLGYERTNYGNQSRDQKDRLKRNIENQMRMRRKGIVTIILTDHQKEELGDILVELGFRCVDHGYSTGHHNRPLFLYVKTNKDKIEALLK